ncbi:MAG: PAS domain S-box protein, partial [Flavobacteriaceae bacterium]|nr:PAS domain S-box protein [Flavobacteriaceae bacterium]
IIDVEIISHSVQFNDRNARYVLISDITERKIAKEALELAHNELENLHDNLNDAIFSMDTVQNKMLVASSAHEQVFGYPPSMFFQNPQLWYELIIPEDKPIADAGYPVLLAGKDLMHELRIAHPSGQLRWIEARMKPKLDGNGKLVRVNGIVTDITGRKIAEQELKKLSHAIEQSPVSVYITDLNGNMEYVNPKTLKISGYTKEELIGKNPRVFSSGEKPKKEYQQLWSTILSGNNWHGEFHNKRKNGELYWESASISPIFNNKHEIINYVAIKEDITELKQFIEDLKITKEKAEESDRLKSAFLANMSHEIRTPMNGILGFTSLLLEPDLSDETKDAYIQIIHQSGERMLNTVTDIVEISKIEAGLITVSNKEIDLNETVNVLVRFFQPESEKKGLKLSIEMLLPDVKKHLLTDRSKLDSIITNLIKNAIKYTDSGTIMVGCRQKGSEVEFYVKDTGIGIPAHRQEAVFNRFEQAYITATRTFEGSGLGLAIAKSYVEMLGGKIRVESKEGLGSIFYFTLPIKSKIEPIAKEIPVAKPAELMRSGMKKLKIILADDDEIALQYLELALADIAEEIVQANTGPKVVELCREHPDFDLILMDIKMPEMNGYKATRRIREFNSKVIIIAQTAYAMSGDSEIAIKAGCNDYIPKPIKKDELLALIQTYFRI